MARALGFAVMAAAAIVPGAALLSLPRRSTSAATSLASTATEADRKSAEAAFREEVERRKLKASRGPEGSAAYLATLGNRMSGYDPNLEYRTYLDDLDNRVSWRFAKELARRKAALEAEREADGYTLTPTDASAAGFRRDAADAAESESLLAWQGAMLFVTIAWATNFAVTAYACDGIAQRTGLDASTAAAAFVVGRFGVAALSTAPLLASASSSRAVAAGLRIGLLYAAGYAAQAAALAHGFPAANCAFVCSLQCVAVALLAPGKTPLRSWVGVALAVGGVACLELLGASEAAPMDGVGLALALGQPLAFGASYVDLERAMEDFPDDSVPSRRGDQGMFPRRASNGGRGIPRRASREATIGRHVGAPVPRDLRVGGRRPGAGLGRRGARARGGDCGRPARGRALVGLAGLDWAGFHLVHHMALRPGVQAPSSGGRVADPDVGAALGGGRRGGLAGRSLWRVGRGGRGPDPARLRGERRDPPRAVFAGGEGSCRHLVWLSRDAARAIALQKP